MRDSDEFDAFALVVALVALAALYLFTESLGS